MAQIATKIWEGTKQKLRALPDVITYMPEGVMCRHYICPFRKDCFGAKKDRKSSFRCNIIELKKYYLEEKEFKEWSSHA